MSVQNLFDSVVNRTNVSLRKFLFAVLFQVIKMKVLELNRKIFILMWIIPNHKEVESPLKRFGNILFSFTVLTLVSTITLSSMTYTVKFASVDLEKTLYAVFQISAYSGQCYMMIVSFRIWPKLAKLFPALQEIYDASK